MNKQDYLSELRNRLNGIPQEDIEERIDFYNEMIDDKTEDGLSEEEAVNEMGNIEETVSQILSEYPLSKIVKEKIKPKHTLKIWEIILIVLGAPLWIPILMSIVAVIASLVITVLSVIFVFWAADFCLMAALPASFVYAITIAAHNNFLASVFSIGAGLICAGLSIIFFFLCKDVTKLIIRFLKFVVLKIKSNIVGKEKK